VRGTAGGVRGPAALAAVLALLVPLLLTPYAGADATGVGGLEVDTSPVEVGTDGELFMDLEFELFCSLRGARLETGLRRLARLARVVSDSGRRVVFTVPPAKALILREQVAWSDVERRRCARSGMREQMQVLDTFAGPGYVSLRRALDRDHRQTYWRTDGHWTSVGATNWTRLLARELDPGLTAHLTYVPGTQTELGGLATLQGSTIPETVPTLTYAGPVRTVTARNSADELGQTDPLTTDHSWVSRPRRLTWPGRSVLIGDSFTLVGLQNLRPLFHRGRYLWTGNVPERTLAEAIADADTVVLEVVHLFTYGSVLGTRSFRELVREELDRGHRER